MEQIAIAVISLLAAGLGSLALYNLSMMQRRAEEQAKELWRAVNGLRTDFLEYKTHVAESYAKVGRLEEMEARLLDKLQRIENKLYGVGDD